MANDTKQSERFGDFNDDNPRRADQIKGQNKSPDSGRSERMGQGGNLSREGSSRQSGQDTSGSQRQGQQSSKQSDGMGSKQSDGIKKSGSNPQTGSAPEAMDERDSSESKNS